MKNAIKVAFSLALFVCSCFAQTTLYIDTQFGSAGSGTQTSPWNSWANALPGIKSALGSASVTVYFSADGTQTAELDVSSITQTSSSHILTLDGASKINTNHASPSPSTWVTNVTLAPCSGFECAKNGPWIGHEFAVNYTGAGGAFTSGNNVNACQNYFVIQGFKLSGQGKAVLATYMGNTTFQYNEMQATTGAAIGPGFYYGAGQSGPCKGGTTGGQAITGTLTGSGASYTWSSGTQFAAGAAWVGTNTITINGTQLSIATVPTSTTLTTTAAGPTCSTACTFSVPVYDGPDNFTSQYNYVHATYGECEYDGASSSDPPGGPGNSEYLATTVRGTSLTCGTFCNTGRNHVIQYNTNESCASWGGQGDGTDIKDGHPNLTFQGNTNIPSLACTSCGGNPGQGGAQGVVFESCALLADNYIQEDVQVLFEGIAMFNSWYNFAGRQDNCAIVNNVVINFNSGVGHNNGIEMQAPAIGGSNAFWTTPVYVLNNSIYSTAASCISLSTSSMDPSAVAIVKNNICESTAGGISGASSHDFNDYFNTGVTCPVSGETHSICTDPQFVSTATPFNANNFQLKSTSPAKATGTNLESLNISALSLDYFGVPRSITGAWDMGFFAFGNAPSAPGPTGNIFAGMFH